MFSQIALSLLVVSIASAIPLQVDLGYSIYRGVADSTTGLTTFKGCVTLSTPDYERFLTSD